MTTIQATGTSELRFPAELATISVRVQETSRNRSESIQKATSRHNYVVALAESLQASGDATKYTADPITTWARQNYVDGMADQMVTDYVTSSGVSITLSNLGIVSDITTSLAEEGVTAYVDWSLSDKTRREAEREARKQAVAKASEVADDYAEALSQEITRVVAITDSQVEMSGGGLRLEARMALSSDSAAQVKVGDIAVSATVTGTFDSE